MIVPVITWLDSANPVCMGTTNLQLLIPLSTERLVLTYSYYSPEGSGNPTACGGMHNSGEAIVAVPIQQFKDSWCNRGIWIKYKGATVNARIVDACVGCPDNSLDLTPSLFRALDGGSLDAGYLWGGSWNFHGEGEDGDDKPTTTSKKPEPTTTKKPDPTTTFSTSTWSSKKTTTTTTTSPEKESSSSSSSSSSRRSSSSSSSWSSTESSTATSSSSSSSQQPNSTPFPTTLPGSVGSLESALGGFAQLLLAGAQQA
ncbi:hypothetical protein BDV98DRAFT_578782 [Pterulicium gracile]|uniref:RlpA-like double-psi beta-barrel-protein domain-containing protein-containing protein n=1 Tax=Pterulicium gracile TaxID=1884261 RepID=A0A5C3R3N0_9AGAR|nr:hypothetical protein BDV98DRAFT_578782 [Pterula gracilis]